jgi:hypothetical protein
MLPINTGLRHAIERLGLYFTFTCGETLKDKYGGLEARFLAPFLVDGGQLFTDGIDDEFMGGNADGSAICLDALEQGLGNLQSRRFISCALHLFAHLSRTPVKFDFETTITTRIIISISRPAGLIKQEFGSTLPGSLSKKKTGLCAGTQPHRHHRPGHPKSANRLGAIDPQFYLYFP